MAALNPPEPSGGDVAAASGPGASGQAPAGASRRAQHEAGTGSETTAAGTEAPGSTTAVTRAAGSLLGWRPWHGRPRTRDLLCVAAIVVSGIYTVATIPLTPALISTNPVLLELLTGSTSSVVAAGAFSAVDSKFQLAVVVGAALPGLMHFDWVFWWAGRLWGRSIVEQLGQRSARAAALAGTVERRGMRFAGPLVVIAAFLPAGVSTAIYAAVGWAGFSLVSFLLFDALGTVIWTTLLAWAGYLLGKEGVTIADLVSRYALVTICVLLAATLAPNLWHAWRQRSRTRHPVADNPALSPGTLPPEGP